MGGSAPGGAVKSRDCYRRARAALAAVGLALPCAHAAGRLLDVEVGGGVSHDSNVFRRPVAISDTIKSGFIGLRLDKTFSQQRFFFDIKSTTYRHDEQPQLDFDGLDYRGGWGWSLTSRLTGSLTADRSESQVPFQDFDRAVKNVRVTTNEGGNFDLWAWRGLHILGGAAHTKQASSQPFLAIPDFESDSVEGGLKYVLPTGNSFALTRRTTHGEYTNGVLNPLVAFDTNWKQNETDIQATWVSGVRTTVTARLGRFERRHLNFQQLDTSGSVGNIELSWKPTAKVDVIVNAHRDLQPYFILPATTHRVDRGFYIAPRWEIRPTLSLRLAFNRAQSEYLGNVTTGSGEARRDNYGSVDFAASWTPLRQLTFTAGVQHIQRASNDSAFNFDATITRLTAAYTF